MILFEWVYDRGERAEGVFCSEKCAEDTYFDNPLTCYKGGPSALDEQESEELAVDWEKCYGCGKPLNKEIVMSDQPEERYLKTGEAIAYLLQQRDIMLDKSNKAETAADCKRFSFEADVYSHKAMTLVLMPTNWK